jgi:MATE family, multidrug efflux pump
LSVFLVEDGALMMVASTIVPVATLIPLAAKCRCTSSNSCRPRSCATEAIGLAAAIWPNAWLGLFGVDPRMLETGTAYLRSVGPTYGFFGLGLSLYFASQGAGRLFWPLLAGLLRLVLAVGGGWAILHLTGSLDWMFAALGVALVVYGLTLVAAIATGGWFGWHR